MGRFGFVAHVTPFRKNKQCGLLTLFSAPSNPYAGRPSAAAIVEYRRRKERLVKASGAALL